MSLAEKLATIREGAAQRIPAETLKTMHAGTQALHDSGILDRVIKPGTPLPAFALGNATGQTVKSEDLLAAGAVILTVFRGHW